jgi:hypothetical protein
VCRNIRVLFNFEPPTTEEEIRAAALQYVRKVSGSTKPAKDNEKAFEKAVDEISKVTAKLLDSLVVHGPPKDREEEARKARLRWQERERRAAAK